jgi:OOP family OmpA-OmpF porin
LICLTKVQVRTVVIRKLLLIISDTEPQTHLRTTTMKKFALASGFALAMAVAAGAQAHPDNSGYWDENPGSTVWSTGSGDCWRHGFWKEDNTIEGCAGYKAPAAEPAPAPMPKTVENAAEKHIVYFDFDSSDAGYVGDITSYISSLTELNSVELVGHADRIGSNEYNDALSQRRVEAVAAALKAGGVDASKISTGHMGEAAPAKSCEGQRSASLIDCLRANRRVEIEITGTKVMK